MAFKIYTKTGDLGQTSLYGGARISKDDIRIEAYGTVDELNAFIGLANDGFLELGEETLLFEIQQRLFTIGSNLASDPTKELPTPDLFEKDVLLIEEEIDQIDNNLPQLKHFILPGGHALISYCHLARTVCRRAERRVVTLSQHAKVEPLIIIYLNRLSDYLFILGRQASLLLNIEDKKWTPRSKNS